MYRDRWIDIQVSPAGEGAVILFRDITDRKLSEHRAAQSLGLIQSSLDALTARVAILDGGGFVITVNKAWQTFNNGKLQIHPGSNYKESCQVSALRDGLIRVLNGQAGCKLAYDLETESGRQWYQVTVTPFKQASISRIVVARSSLRIDLTVDDEVDGLPYEFQRTVLRIGQEALANAHRHARATSVDIKMTVHDDELRLVVRDDGQGMPHASMDELAEGFQLGVGIAGMKARTDQLGGNIEFITNSNGTTVIVAIPLPDAARLRLQAPAEGRLAVAAR
jgi:anti-sigma regulatory factor (Ser/Thr protein kinase)